MVPPASHRVSRVRRYSGSSLTASSFAYGILTLCDGPSHALRLNSTTNWLSSTVWPLPRSLATTDGISVDVSSSPYLDVSVQAVPRVRLWIQRTLTGYCPAGLPHSEIPGSMDICSSPRLIAACHVLHRLLMPRHSPCALFSLTFSNIHALTLPLLRQRILVLSLRIMQASQMFRFYCSFTRHPFGCFSTI